MAKTPAPAIEAAPETAAVEAPESPFAAELAQAEAEGAKAAQVVYSGTKGASPALRVDY